MVKSHLYSVYKRVTGLHLHSVWVRIKHRCTEITKYPTTVPWSVLHWQWKLLLDCGNSFKMCLHTGKKIKWGIHRWVWGKQLNNYSFVLPFLSLAKKKKKKDNVRKGREKKSLFGVRGARGKITPGDVMQLHQYVNIKMHQRQHVLSVRGCE